MASIHRRSGCAANEQVIDFMVALHEGATLQGGKYKIERVLGQGGFGITYLAIQSGLERKVAIKEFFMKELCERDESTSHVTLGTEGSRETVNRFREKFLKEARNIARLNHPNIVRIIDVFEENGTAYYVMEYAENGSLADKVKREGYLTEPVATRYILQVADALDYIHQRKMNHLDVKPANIMLNENDEAILIDFGLSKQYDAVTGGQTSTTPVGISEGYAPMEQYKQGGVGEFSPETDIYALGATFFKLLTGITPPSASDIYEDGVPVGELKAKGVSQKAIDVICKAMEGRKKDRMKEAAIFVTSLEDNKKSVPSSSCAITDNDEVTVQKVEPPKKDNEHAVEGNISTKVAQERVEFRGTPTRRSHNKSKILIWSLTCAAIIVVLVYLIKMQNSHSSKTQITNSHTSVESSVKYVEDATIVLTKGHESKRNFVYTGEVDAEGLPHGEGTAKYPKTKSCSSCTFTGTFEHGITSQGEMTFSSGTKFVGSFTLDGFFHEGTWTEKDGYYFKGTFGNGEPYNGTWYTPHGKEDGRLVYGQYK